MDVSVRVDAFTERVFPARVLKIEPQSVDDQGKTMFPVLIRIPNEDVLLKPGMNTKVEIHIGQREQVASVPNAALRSLRDLSTAATVIGSSVELINDQLAEAARIASGDTAPPPPPAPESDSTFSFRGETHALPAGVSKAQASEVLAKLAGGNFQDLSTEDRSVMQSLMRTMGGGGQGGQRRGGGGGRRGGAGGGSSFQFGGTFVVFTMNNGEITPVEIRTGLTDLEYSEVVSGLMPGDSILLLPSSSLVQSQQQIQDRIARFSGGLPGVGGGRGRR
jgi:multidrug efflux pump subunit AcrA (membrane-fusion protein)